ncbi:NADP-dependent oxidoreductase [Brevibacterium sp. 239c]|uniref:NADP-dependent oxidoreductase n=1 Tax=Brevibacterium sp. 239c TaxID=1965356 RepID=UPI001C60E844|nr:NADP-dependent oxidoreductase [Brevibacterium sp. 239c]
MSEKTTMRAIEYSTFGGPDVLRLEEVDLPEPGPGQVRVAVHAAGVNTLDWKIREGQLGEQPMPQRPGLELAGVVDATGSGCRATIGEQIFGWSLTGAYADYALADIVASKPRALPWHEAASLPVAGEAAVRALRELEIRPGETLLIHGASGTVGTIATQLAIAAGAIVIGTADDANTDYLSGLGAIPVKYGGGLTGRVREITTRIDAVLDAAGFGALPDLLALRGSTERILTLADSAASRKGVRFSSRTPSVNDAESLTELATKVTTGQLRLRRGHIYSLPQAADAQQDSATSHTRGKITLKIS